MKKEKHRIRAISIRTKFLLVMAAMLAVILGMNILLYAHMNIMVEKIDSVFASNVTIQELSGSLENVHSRVEEYLNTRSSTALEDYYRSSQEYQEKLENLNSKNVDNEIRILEKNIRNMSETFLENAEDTIQAKRGRNVERYKALFEEENRLYKYINNYIYELNTQRFSQNSNNYEILLHSLGIFETLGLVAMMVVFVMCLLMGLLIVREMIRPLSNLSVAARNIAEGDFDTELPETVAPDEVGIVTDTFRQMVVSIRNYISQIRTSMETEARMKERELSMEAHLKEAQLKFLQAQINPHFLFNSLNAGVQLAAMEDAEQTGIFLERMADFFRYNVKKTGGDVTLKEELQTVDNYIYILNVRFSGDIRFSKEIAPDVPDIRMPSMILQPIVENAVQHGIRERMEDGWVRLSVDFYEGCVRVVVADNGAGMTGEQITEILDGRALAAGEENASSTGIAVYNVMNRLKLYYNRDQLLTIYSGGKGSGTEVTILLPAAQTEGE